jgi:hypothetical protein
MENEQLAADLVPPSAKPSKDWSVANWRAWLEGKTEVQ